MSNGADRRKFEAAWLAANDDRTPDGQRAECYRFMAKMSQKYDTRAWKAELEAKHGPAQQTQQPAGQQSTGRQGQSTGGKSEHWQGAEEANAARNFWNWFWNLYTSDNPEKEFYRWFSQKPDEELTEEERFQKAYHEAKTRWDETGEWDDGFWEKWGRTGGGGYHTRYHYKPGKRGYPPGPKKKPRPKPAAPKGRITGATAAQTDEGLLWLAAGVAFLFVSLWVGLGIMFAGYGIQTALQNPVQTLTATTDGVGGIVSLAWHRRDLVLYIMAALAGVWGLRGILAGEYANGRRFVGGMALLVLLVWAGASIGPPL